eukprot:gene25913-33869_t
MADAGGVPVAAACLLERVGQLSGDPAADEARYEELLATHPIAPEGSVPEAIRRHLLFDVGPAALAAGGDPVLMMRSMTSMARLRVRPGDLGLGGIDPVAARQSHRSNQLDAGQCAIKRQTAFRFFGASRFASCAAVPWLALDKLGFEMKFFGNLSIQSKILSALGLFVLLCSFLVWFGSIKLETASATTRNLVDNQSESLRVAALAMEHATKIQSLYWEMVSRPTTEQAGLLGEVAAERKAMADNFVILRPFIDGPDVARFAAIEAGLREYLGATARIPGMVVAGQRDAAGALMESEISAIYDRTDEAFNALVDQQKSDLATGASLGEKDAAASLWTLIVAAVAGLLAIGAAALLLVRRQIVSPLNAITSTMTRLAGGDNNLVVAGIERGDEVGAMARALLVFRDAAAAKAAADAAKAAADATSQMVIDTLGSSLSELRNRDLTSRVTAEYPGSYEVLKTNFNEALGSVQTAMQQVSESAVNIRTGSQEIAQASEDLRARDQLTLTQTDIVTAVQAVQKVDGALANISGDVDEVHKLLGTMADDATAQSSAISQITAAIGAMDQSTQQNAAMVEQTSAAARNLTAEVTSLAEQAAMFRTEGGAGGHYVRQPAAASALARKKAVPPTNAPAKPAKAAAPALEEWAAF